MRVAPAVPDDEAVEVDGRHVKLRHDIGGRGVVQRHIALVPLQHRSMVQQPTMQCSVWWCGLGGRQNHRLAIGPPYACGIVAWKGGAATDRWAERDVRHRRRADPEEAWAAVHCAERRRDVGQVSSV